MPLYDYYCNKCNKIKKDIKIKLTEKEITVINCICGSEMIQSVSPLRFKLIGAGWYENNDHPYTITQQELNKNLDYEKRAENYAYEMQEKDNRQ